MKNKKLTVEDIINYGFVELIDKIGSIYYLEFYFCTEVSTSVSTEQRYYLGTITCNEFGNIFKATLKSYAFSNSNQFIGFTQFINKNDNININDIFIVDNKTIKFTVPSIKETHNVSNGSRMWVMFIKKKHNYYTDTLYINNVCSKDYFIEMQDRTNIIEFFKEEKEKFGLLSNAIIQNGISVNNGLNNVAGSISAAGSDFNYSYRKVNGILGH